MTSHHCRCISTRLRPHQKSPRTKNKSPLTPPSPGRASPLKSIGSVGTATSPFVVYYYTWIVSPYQEHTAIIGGVPQEMRIATYNIWNTDYLWVDRLQGICEEIYRIKPDIIALQEVRAVLDDQAGLNAAAYIAKKSEFQHSIFRAYPHDNNEGLAILSQLPIYSAEAGWDNSENRVDCGIRIVINANNARIAVTNVHVHCNPTHFITREYQVTTLIDWISSRQQAGVQEFLCGDFNCSPDSSIHRFLVGQQSLHGRSTYWFDLAAYYAHRSGSTALPTLDFDRNPRWENQHTLEIPASSPSSVILTVSVSTGHPQV